jgi:hypothetical protein
MSDFFGALELELRAAAKRRPRRRVSIGQALGALAAAALLATAIGVVLAISGGGDGGGGGPAQVTGGPKLDPVGTVIPKGEGQPPRSRRSIVVATGTQAIAGPWQLEVQPSELLRDDRGEVIQPAGLRCVFLYMLDPPNIHGATGSGYCGEQPRTPGFTRGQATVHVGKPVPSINRGARDLVMIYGRAPERAEYFRLTVGNNRLGMRGPVFDGPKNMRGDYYVTTVPTHIGRTARINWLDKDKKPGSRGTPLLPPVTGKVRR